jgi:hypothetical protein
MGCNRCTRCSARLSRLNGNEESFLELSGYLRRNIKHLRWRCSCILARDAILLPVSQWQRPRDPKITLDSTSTERSKRFAQSRYLENPQPSHFPQKDARPVDRMCVCTEDVLPCISPAGWVGKHRHRKRIASVAWPWRVVEELEARRPKKTTVSRNRPIVLFPTAAHAQHIN